MSSITLSIESILIYDLHGEKYMYIFHHHTLNRGIFFKSLYLIHGFHPTRHFDAYDYLEKKDITKIDFFFILFKSLYKG